MFVCGLYLIYFEFLVSVCVEVEVVVKWLCYYVCLVFWCGNNEDYMLVELFGFVGFGVLVECFEVWVIYEGLLFEVCVVLDFDCFYWFGSFFMLGEGVKLFDVIVGDRYSWEVWY